MRPFEEHYECAVQESLKRETRYDIRAWERRRCRAERLPRIALRASVLVWAVFIVGVLLFGPKPNVEIPVESVRSTETDIITVEPVPAMVLTLDAPCLDTEAREPESPFYRENIPLDYETQELLYEACGETGIRYELALAMVWRETTFRNVVGDGGESYGYMQVQPKWHADRMTRLGVDDLMDPAGNFRVGLDYMAELLDKYELPEALTAYNTGSPGHNQYADDVIGYMEELT